MEKRLNGDCIEVFGCSTNDGYPRYSVNGVLDFGHRHSYRQHFGEIPKEMVVMHSCDNRSCVNINHLSLGTIQDNIKDRDLKGRTAKGEKNGRSKLSEKDVLSILKSTDSSWKLSKSLNVDPKVIRDIRGGKTWRYLTNIIQPPINA
jgi:hypothetical protein